MDFLPLPLEQKLLSDEYIYLQKRSRKVKKQESKEAKGQEILQIPFCFDKFLQEQPDGDALKVQATHTN